MRKVSFFAYYLSLRQNPNPEKFVKPLLLQMLYAIIFGLVAALLCDFNPIVLIIGMVAFFASIPQQWTRASKPNLTSLIPLSQTRKTVYTVLYIPAMFFMSLLICAAFISAIWLFSGLCAAAIVRDTDAILSMFRIYTEGLEVTFADGYAVLLFLSLIIFNMGAGMVYSNIDSRKYRNITALSLFVVYLTGAEVLLQIALKYEITSTSLKVTHIAGYAGANIRFLPLPWLAVLLCAITSLAVLGVGIYLTVQKNKTKNY